MSKKAQIQQVFIYLMAILVIGFLVLFGFRMINKLLHQKCEVEKQTMKNKLLQDIDGATRFGSRTKVVLSRPCDYQELCVVDHKFFSGSNSNKLDNSYKNSYPMIWANSQDNIQYNVYLRRPNGDTLPVLFDERILTSKDGSGSTPLFCVNSSNGQFAFWLEGLGKKGVYAFAGATS